ncbi:hypothetical protein DPMN_058630 [Dreissena polymorpha]|uniref:Uncharacterized protein n=1 Tax=Dreissena polymorpha TaxID=45954 RepID=A0A9D4C2D9_DREPO|nr:hypothetical protein DPMN_058630 [Dreissena polymorpha]
MAIWETIPVHSIKNNEEENTQNIIGTNLLTKFHEDRKINVASRVLTRKNAPPPGSHFHGDRTVNVASRVLSRFDYSHPFFQANIFIFELIKDIIKTNLLTKCHEDWTINVASRVLTRKNAPPLIIGTNLLTKFHDDRKINVTSKVGHVFQPTGIIFQLVQDIIGMNLLTEFHEDKCGLYRKMSAPWRPCFSSKRNHFRTHPSGHVFQANVTIFELIQDIIKTNLLTIFHQDWTINKKCPAPCGHVFQPTGIIFVLVQDIIEMNLLTNFHEDWTINVASRVHIEKKAPPLGSHVFQAKVTIFKVIQGISGTNLLTKFHEDRKINVAYREKCPTPGGHVFQPTSIIFKLVQDFIGINLLSKFHEDQTINVASRVKNAPPLGSHTINVASIELTSQLLTPHNARRTKGDHKSST